MKSCVASLVGFYSKNTTRNYDKNSFMVVRAALNIGVSFD